MIFCVFRAYCDARQATATTERIVADACYTIGNYDACQAIAIRECIVADACDTVGDSDTR